MVLSSIGIGLDHKRDIQLLRDQVIMFKNCICYLHNFFLKIEEIRGTVLLPERNALGVQYGIDPKNLDCPLDDLLNFDMTR